MAEVEDTPPGSSPRVLITGANGHLGRRLITVLSARGPVVAVVRSTQAAQQLAAMGIHANLAVHVLDYTDTGALRRVAAGCARVVHLSGIIKESASNSYVQAHEETCRALVGALDPAVVRKLVYLSILGSSADSANACLASKGRAEQILLASGLPVVSLRVPMVLGEGDYAARALQARANKKINLVFRSQSAEQPIYAGDVVKAMVAALESAPGLVGALDLAGIQSLSRKELIQRAAGTLHRQTTVISVPVWVGMLVAGILQRVLKNPPVTTAMLGVLDHDDHLDTTRTCEVLGIQLMSLDETLQRVLRLGG